MAMKHEKWMIEQKKYLDFIFAPDNKQELSALQKKLKSAFNTELTPRQRLYMKHYFWDGWSMKGIGEKYDRDTSTVSRTINRGVKRLRRVLQFTSWRFLR